MMTPTLWDVGDGAVGNMGAWPCFMISQRRMSRVSVRPSGSFCAEDPHSLSAHTRSRVQRGEAHQTLPAALGGGEGGLISRLTLSNSTHHRLRPAPHRRTQQQQAGSQGLQCGARTKPVSDSSERAPWHGLP